jgi:hypothetical protein
MVEESSEEDDGIAAVRDNVQQRVVALLGAELGEQLLAGVSGRARRGAIPQYTSQVKLVPVSVKVRPREIGAATGAPVVYPAGVAGHTTTCSWGEWMHHRVEVAEQ